MSLVISLVIHLVS